MSIYLQNLFVWLSTLAIINCSALKQGPRRGVEAWLIAL